MDFPIKLSSRAFVSGLSEFKQVVILMLKTYNGGFLQNPTIGSVLSVHETDRDLIDESIRSTLSQINGVSVTSVTISEDYTQAAVSLVYNGKIVNFVFNINIA